MNFKDIIFSNIYRNIPAFGLDISDSSIKIAQLEKKGRGFKLKNFNRFALPAGIVEEGEIKDEKKLIEKLKESISGVKGEKIKTKYAVCSLPEQHAFVKVINFPKMTIEEIKRAIKWEAEANIPFSLDEVYLTWQIVSPWQNSSHVDVLVNAVPKKLVDKYLEVLRAANIEPVVFEVESAATARSLISGGKVVKPALIIDLGFDRTSFIIFSGDSICFTNSTSMVSNKSMLEDLAQKLNIDFKKAQSLKFKIGLGKTEEEQEIFNALLPSLTKLLEKIKECISFHQEHADKDGGCTGINEIILCGGGANLKGISEYLTSRLKIPVAAGNPWINIFSNKNKKHDFKKLPPVPYEESLAYSTVLGLALRGAQLK
jgi:type IV pilus assembly protein PilM